ncbi:hypothetical protein Bca4012_021203 [Brassica carinata]
MQPCIEMEWAPKEKPKYTTDEALKNVCDLYRESIVKYSGETPQATKWVEAVVTWAALLLTFAARLLLFVCVCQLAYKSLESLIVSKALYIKNLPRDITQERLKALFEHHRKILKVVIPPAKPGKEDSRYGFVHYAERTSVMKALKNTERYEIDVLAEARSSLSALQSKDMLKSDTTIAKERTTSSHDVAALATTPTAGI